MIIYMKKTYFEIDEDFNKIIQQRLKDIKNIKLIPTGWTNIVFEVKTAKNNLKYIFIHYFFQNVLSLSDSKLINIYVLLIKI